MSAQSGNTPSQAPADQPVVLVAEDDQPIAFLLQYMLEREGFHVLLASDGRQAQEIIDSIPPPQLTLLDIMMPHADGFEVLAHLRAKPGWRDTPVIMLTARSQAQDIERARQAGASDYLVKPFLPEELKARIHRLLSRHP